MILYFTGTGNSKFVAKEIGCKLGEKPVSLFEYIKGNKTSNFESADPFVFVTPTYAWRIPKIVEEFIQKAHFANGQDAYFVLTCGDNIGNAGKYAKQLCESKGLCYKGIFKIVMPENYIAMFSVPKMDEAIGIVKASLPEIDKVARYIAQRKEHYPKTTFADNILSSVVNQSFYSLFVKDKAFQVLDSCNGCGLCESICPLNNINLQDGKPIWNGTCTHCMACINSCPQEAIEYGGKSIGKPRYICPTREELE